MMEKILVSIVCDVYNHESFLTRCLEGFVSQKTKFNFEVLIHDDASTDRSASIIKKYTLKYPSLFKPYYQKENQYSKGIDCWTIQFPRAKGKYIALCEGDDYWIDPYKLQKQVDILENNLDCILCSTGYVKDYGQKKEEFIIFRQSKKFSLKDFSKNWLCKTLTVLFRTEGLADFLANVYKYKYTRDTHLYYHLLRQGKGYYISEVTGVYNIHFGGICSLVDPAKNAVIAYNIYSELYNNYPDYFTRKGVFNAVLFRLYTEAYKTKKERSLLLRKSLNFSQSFLDMIRIFRYMILKILKLK